MAVAREIEPWDALLEAGRRDERLVASAREGARAADSVPIPEDLHPAVREGLGRAGIDELYSHQAQALDAAAQRPVVVTTGTASGKSLCFNLPVLDVLCTDARARALYLYPTKALAQDQARALHSFGLKALRPAIYDGDTPRAERAAIRKRANVVLTNPDMLHVGILPNHGAWAELFANLAAVVVDEAHVYRGVFGSHVGNVLRRLRRIAAAYGTNPRFLLASATIANPVDLAEGLTGLEDFALVDRDGSPGAARQIAMWNPPLVDEALGSRRSPLPEAAEIVADLVEAGARTICFMKSRRAVELIARYVQQTLRQRDARLAERVAPYRAGYTPAQRREIERRLTEGDLLAVITTDALELGIDIGALDAAVSVTFPGTVASLRQQWGRAGRRGRGLAVYIAGEDALDQFFCRHPDEFLDRPVEAAILDHESPEIHLAHVRCAASEGPLDDADRSSSAPAWRGYAERWRRWASCASATGRSSPPPPGLPGGRGLPALLLGGDVRAWSTPPRARSSARSRRRERSPPPTTARSTCTWAGPTRSRRWTSSPVRRSSARSRATGSRSPRRRPRRRSSGCSTAARPSG